MAVKCLKLTHDHVSIKIFSTRFNEQTMLNNIEIKLFAVNTEKDHILLYYIVDSKILKIPRKIFSISSLHT